MDQKPSDLKTSLLLETPQPQSHNRSVNWVFPSIIAGILTGTGLFLVGISVIGDNFYTVYFSQWVSFVIIGAGYHFITYMKHKSSRGTGWEVAKSNYYDGESGRLSPLKLKIFALRVSVGAVNDIIQNLSMSLAASAGLN
jgi:hypothetical protein